MALLAEQKRKVKFGLDPRNTTWSNDESKLGQKLMEKMGWTKGKGLGANEDGITDHIKASYKSDSRGLGCTLKDADAWVAHQDDFNDILKALNSENSTEPVETKKDIKTDSKRFYGRFARGRVPTLRSTEDLDCIFGKRKTAKSDVVEESKVDENPAVSSDNTENSHGLTTTTSTCSVQEYFARKMAEKKLASGINDSLASVGDQGSESKETEKRPSFGVPQFSAVGFSYNDKPAEQGEAAESKDNRGWYDEFIPSGFIGDGCEADVSKSKKKKKKKSKDEAENEPIEKSDSCEDVSKSKKKKKKKSKDEAENDFIEKSDSCQDVSKSKKKKKKKSKDEADNDSIENNNSCEDVSVDVSKSKKKKKKKSKDEAGNDSIEEVSKKRKNTGNEDLVEEEVSKKKKRKKNLSESAEQNIVEEDHTIGKDNVTENKKRKNKENEDIVEEELSKKKKKSLSENSELNIAEEEHTISKDSVSVNKKRKKKHKGDAKMENNENQIIERDLQEKDNVEKKKKNKNGHIVSVESAEVDSIDDAPKESNMKLDSVVDENKEKTVEVKEVDPKGRKRKYRRGKKKSKNESLVEAKPKQSKAPVEPKPKKTPESLAVEKAFKGSNVSDIWGYGGFEVTVEDNRRKEKRRKTKEDSTKKRSKTNGDNTKKRRKRER